MAAQTATALYDPAETSPTQLVSAFADAKAAGESRFALTMTSGSTEAPAQEGSGTSDSSNDFAPPVPPGGPDFGADDGSGSTGAPAGGGDFVVSLEAPAN